MKKFFILSILLLNFGKVISQNSTYWQQNVDYKMDVSINVKTYLYKGKKVGTHRGYPFYTIGQRKGLDLAMGEPVFVKEIIPETNTVVLGDTDMLTSHL